MRDLPIIYSAPMILALLEGRKTMTRRLAWREGSGAAFRATVEAKVDAAGRLKVADDGKIGRVVRTEVATPWQKVEPGDRLWVRESLTSKGTGIWRYAADETGLSFAKKDPRFALSIGWAHHKETSSAPSIHMPRWASRLTLIVEAKKIERLNIVSSADALAEGISAGGSQKYERRYPGDDDAPILAFGELWDSIHGTGSWDENPEVVAISFRVIRSNIDAIKEAA